MRKIRALENKENLHAKRQAYPEQNRANGNINKNSLIDMSVGPEVYCFFHLVGLAPMPSPFPSHDRLGSQAM